MMQPVPVPPGQMLANGEQQQLVLEGPSHDHDAGDTYLNGEVQQQIHPNMNGGTMPPQQVYVHDIVDNSHQNGLGGLETQFQSLGFTGEDVDLEDMEHLEDDISVDDDGEDDGDDPLKLFVGQVRYHRGTSAAVGWSLDGAAEKMRAALPVAPTRN